MEEILIILPLFITIEGRTHLAQLKTPVRLTSITSCHSSGVILAKVLSLQIPALLTNTSILVNSASIALVIASTSPNFETSATKAPALPPLLIISFFTTSKASLLMSFKAIVAPKEANFKAITLPIP
ncbi:MAG: hypothetical protein BWY21_01502 [Parcubacteria group bacterium ADurb.Bin216]|nr:MAG: hypothetical protein BWY21_01502 [Parcubacteria group bacterium ADurb.Bin216]